MRRQFGGTDRIDDTAPRQRSAVDLWIARELQLSYNQTLSEPVPESLLRLIDRFPVQV